MFARQPAGFALGALAGPYPSPGFGLPAFTGPALTDDFVHQASTIIANRYGSLFWGPATIGASPPGYTSVAPTSHREIGILRITTQAVQATGSTIILGAAAATFYRWPPPGTIWCVKLRIGTLTTVEAWSGFASSATGQVRTADATQFVGVRYDSAASGNLIGVVKNSTGESTVDLGITPLGSLFYSVGFEVGGTITAPEFQFFTLNELATTNSPPVWDRRDLGSPITSTTNLPTTNLFPIGGGIVTNAAAARTLDLDAWACGGFCAR